MQTQIARFAFAFVETRSSHGTKTNTNRKKSSRYLLKNIFNKAGGCDLFFFIFNKSRRFSTNHVDLVCQKSPEGVVCKHATKKNHETMMLMQNLRHLSPCHRHGHAFSRYFIINIKSIIIPSFSFIEADLAKRHLLIGVLDGTLKL